VRVQSENEKALRKQGSAALVEEKFAILFKGEYNGSTIVDDCAPQLASTFTMGQANKQKVSSMSEKHTYSIQGATAAKDLHPGVMQHGADIFESPNDAAAIIDADSIGVRDELSGGTLVTHHASTASKPACFEPVEVPQTQN